MDSPRALLQRTHLFFSGTMISRITGLGRDISMAVLFGSHPSVAAFFVAFRLSNLFRRLFGEGAMHATFVPNYEEKRLNSESEAQTFYQAISTAMSLVLILLIGLIEIGIFIGFKWGIFTTNNREIAIMTAIMLPSLFFICHSALNTSLLQCRMHFFLPSMAPAISNIIWILGAFTLANRSVSEAMPILSAFVVISFLGQWLFLSPQVFNCVYRSSGFHFFKVLNKQKSNLIKLLKPFFLGVLGVTATQLNSALDALFARYADLEGPVYLWYAIRIQQLPLALFGVGLAGASLPALSRAFKSGDLKSYGKLYTFSIEKSFGFLFPAILGIVLLGASGLNFLFGRGEFGLHALKQTTFCLWSYGAGLIPAALVILTAPALYAQGKYHVTTKCTVLSVLINILLNAGFVFIFHWGAVSIAIATSIAAWFNFFLLWWAIQKDLQSFHKRSILRSFMKLLTVSILVGLFCYILGHPVLENSVLHWERSLLYFPRNWLFQSILFVFESILVIGVLLTVAYLFKIKEILSLIFPSKYSNKDLIE